MVEYSSTAAEEDKDVVISDSGDNDGIVEILDGSPHIPLPPEVWAMVINCEYHIYFIIQIVY